MSYCWEGSRRSGCTMAMHHGLKKVYQGPRDGVHHPTHAPCGVWQSLLLVQWPGKAPICLQCFDTVGSASWRVAGLWTVEWLGTGVVICPQRSANDMCIWSNWCYFHPIISCFVKIPNSRCTFLVLVLPRLCWNKVPLVAHCPSKNLKMVLT